MSASAMVPKLPDQVRLALAATRALPRALILELVRSTNRLYVHVGIKNGPCLVFTSTQLDRCHLQLRTPQNDQPALWLDVVGETYATVHLSPGEAEAIAAQFEPHGLKVQR